MQSDVRVVALHAHLFKNAGSSFDWSLQRAFGACFCDHRDDEAMRGNPAYLALFLRENPDLQALSSHWLPQPLPESEGLCLLAFTLLRDPLERMASVYAFERRQAVDHPGTERARRLQFRDYVAWRMQERVGPVLRNYQTRMLSGDYPGDGGEEQFALAVENLDAFAGVGVVEHYDRSMVLFEERLRPHFPRINLAYVAQNVSDHRDTRSFAQRRRDVEAELGEVLLPALAANAADLRLYELATRRFETQWKKLCEAEAKLADFKRRCAELAEQVAQA